MSYALHVWETPVPRTLAEAATAALDMGGDHLGQNPGFMVLAGRLTSRYPDLDAGMAPGTSVWSDAVIDGRTEERAWKIGVRREHVRVISLLVVQANRLGLCVFDMQQQIAWLPGGTVLRAAAAPARRVPPARLVADDRLTKFEMVGALRRLTHTMLAPHGYVFEDDADEVRYRLALPGGWIRAVPLVWDYSPGYRYSFVFEVHHDRVADILAAFDALTPDERSALCSATIGLRDMCPGDDRDLRIGSVRRLQLELESLEGVFREQIVPVLEMCRTIAGLERFVNRAQRVRSARDSGALYAQDIVLARLAGNPGWEQVGADCIGALGDSRVADRERLERLMDYLRTVDPEAE